MSIGTKSDNKDYFRPVSDGKIVKKITQQEYETRIQADAKDNVRKREWSAGDKSGVAYEEYYQNVKGHIVNVSFREHDEYGRSIALLIRTSDGEEGVFTVNTGDRFGMSLMESLPNVDFEKEVTISAWVKADGEKTKKAIFISQGTTPDDNVKNHFKTWDDKGVMTVAHDYPEVIEKEQKKFGKDYWTKRFFPEVEVFLVEYIEKNVMPKSNVAVVVPEDDDTISPDDIAF